MPYVRTHGNQVTIVHGDRDKSTSKVQQRVLFTFYSKKEAAAAIGDAGSEDCRYFENLLTDANPQLTFDWPEIRTEIRSRMDVLPDIYPLKKVRSEDSFESAFLEFTRHVAITDPDHSKAGRETLKKYRDELLVLQKLLSLRLAEIDTPFEKEDRPFDLDDTFCWRYEIQSHTMPLGLEEFADNLYEEGNHQEAKPLYALLTRCFPEYADGHNRLGLLALNDGNAKEAAEHFRATAKFGRTLFPRRVAKSDYWRDVSTRPYIRGLMNLALALNQAGQFKEALSICDQLFKECGPVGVEAAWAHRATAHLNLLNWSDSLAASMEIIDGAPDEGFVAGFALFELERYQECIQWFLYASLNSPHSAHILLDKKKTKPETYSEIEDHNGGLTLVRSLPRFWQMRSKQSTKFFRNFIEHAMVKTLLAEAMDCERTKVDLKNKSSVEKFDRLIKLKSVAFAKKEGKALSESLLVTAPRLAGKKR